MRRSYFDMPYGQIHYRRAGHTHLPSLIFFHQSPSSSEMYESLMEVLSPEFNIIAPDTPGFGLSDPPANTSIHQIRDIFIQFFEGLSVENAFFFGHHTGAIFASAIGAKASHLCSKMALSGPPLLDENLRRTLPSLAMDEPVVADGSHLHRMWDKFGRKSNAIHPEIIQRELIQALYCGTRNKQMYQAIAGYDFAKDLERLSMPVLTLAGSEDVLIPQLSVAHGTIPQSQKLVIQGAASYICDTHTQELAEVLRVFFLGT